MLPDTRHFPLHIVGAARDETIIKGVLVIVIVKGDLFTGSGSAPTLIDEVGAGVLGSDDDSPGLSDNSIDH